MSWTPIQDADWLGVVSEASRYLTAQVGRDLARKMVVEAKWSDAPVDKSLRYLKQRYPRAEAWQISAQGTKDFTSEEGIRVAPALRLLSALV